MFFTAGDYIIYILFKNQLIRKLIYNSIAYIVMNNLYSLSKLFSLIARYTDDSV